MHHCRAIGGVLQLAGGRDRADVLKASRRVDEVGAGMGRAARGGERRRRAFTGELWTVRGGGRRCMYCVCMYSTGEGGGKGP